MAKSEFLQIRVSRDEKLLIQKAATAASKSLSEWVLSKAISLGKSEFSKLILKLARAKEPSFVLSELNDFLSSLKNEDEFNDAVSEDVTALKDEFLKNYVAAMIETLAYRKNWETPAWVRKVPALRNPYFGADLQNLRIYLLINSPPAFKARNIFIDATVGHRV